jgi:excisionase family DNA binding protein
MAKKTSGKLLNTDEAAERLDVTKHQVRVLIREGKLPAQKIGRDWVIAEEALEQAQNRPRPGRPKKKKSEDDEDEDE